MNRETKSLPLPLTSAASSPTYPKLLDGPFKTQAVTENLAETTGSGEHGSINEFDTENGDGCTPVVLRPTLIGHETTALQRIETWKMEVMTGGSTMKLFGNARQPKNTLGNPAEENISFGTEAKRSFKQILVSAIRTASTNLIIRYTLGLSLLTPFSLFVIFYATPWISVLVLKKSLVAVFDYLQSPVYIFWGWSNNAFYIAQSYSYSYIFITLGSLFGFISPTVLPPLGDEYAIILPPIRSVPLTHVDGMALAAQVTAPHVNELEYYVDIEQDTPRNELHLLDGLVIQLPSEPFEPTISTKIDAIAADNKLLGARMSRSLDAERNALHNFRRVLRSEPTAGLLEKSQTSPGPSKNAVASNRWSTIRQTIQTKLLRWIRLSAKSHLLRHLNRLESILKDSQIKRGEWDRHLYDSSLSKLHILVVPLCQASKMLSDIKWKLEAKIDELPPPLTRDDEKDVANPPISNNKVVDVETLSNNIRVVQSNYGHMCLFALEDRKVATEIMSKVADDGKRYRKALESLIRIRARVESSSLTDSRSILAFEREMDNIALSMLAGIKYWEEQQKAD